MSVLIKGVVMPKSCQECTMNCLRGFNGSDFLANKRADGCQLVEIKPPHGRLIDAEAFNDYMQNRYDNNELTNGDWIDFRLSLKDQPTIVPAEGGGEDGQT